MDLYAQNFYFFKYIFLFQSNSWTQILIGFLLICGFIVYGSFHSLFCAYKKSKDLEIISTGCSFLVR